MIESNFKKLNNTWFIDLDGTIVVHNGYLSGQDELLPGVKDFFSSLNSEDYVIVVTARSSIYRQQTEQFLRENAIVYHQIFFDLPVGRRIIINDLKPDETKTAFAINLKRNVGLQLKDYNEFRN